MKYLLTIMAIFALAFAATLLLDIPFIAKSMVRSALVVIFIAFIFVFGLAFLFALKDVNKKS